MILTERQEKYLKMISKSGLLRILMTLSKPLGFSELMFEVRLNPGVVDRNLKALLEHSLVERKENKYFLTEKGKKVVLLLKKFSEILSS